MRGGCGHVTTTGFAMRYSSTAAWLAVIMMAAAGNAFAHAELKSSMPEKDARLKAAPTEVSIMFDEEVNPKLSLIVVQDAKGQPVDKADSHLVGGDAKHLSVDLNPLPAGTYQVIWTSVAADDGHKLSASFSFTVAP
jgi:methionine-rich copper-binding protein CopC